MDQLSARRADGVAVKRLSGLGYIGGKSANGRGSGQWIADQLPYRTAYLEPFAGMLGVLLQRTRCRREVVNDLDERVMNWWAVLRDNWQELERLFLLTPRWSKTLVEEAVAKEEAALDAGDRVAAAYYMTIRGTQGFARSINSTAAGRSYTEFACCPPLSELRVRELWERIRRVELENIDAVEFLDRYGQMEDAVFYCDPPYPTGITQHYTHKEVDMDGLTDQLVRVAGFCAISGYGDEWDHLGWHRYELKIKNTLTAKSYVDRTEVLWSNQPTSGQNTLDI